MAISEKPGPPPSETLRITERFKKPGRARVLTLNLLLLFCGVLEACKNEPHHIKEAVATVAASGDITEPDQLLPYDELAELLGSRENAQFVMDQLRHNVFNVNFHNILDSSSYGGTAFVEDLPAPPGTFYITTALHVIDGLDLTKQIVTLDRPGIDSQPILFRIVGAENYEPVKFDRSQTDLVRLLLAPDDSYYTNQSALKLHKLPTASPEELEKLEVIGYIVFGYPFVSNIETSSNTQVAGRNLPMAYILHKKPDKNILSPTDLSANISGHTYGSSGSPVVALVRDSKGDIKLYVAYLLSGLGPLNLKELFVELNAVPTPFPYSTPPPAAFPHRE